MRWAPPKIQTGSQGDSGTMILILVILCCVSLVVGGAIWFVFFRKSEGDDCTPKNNPNALGVLDSNLDCIFSACKPTYAPDATGNCVIDQSGTICSPAVGDPIDKGVYRTNVSNVCTLEGCESGYELVGGKCNVIEDGNICIPTGTGVDKGVYTMTGGVCTLRGCQIGHKLENLACVASTPGDDIKDGNECEPAVGDKDTRGTYIMTGGVCTLTACDSTSDLKDGACVTKSVENNQNQFTEGTGCTHSSPIDKGVYERDSIGVCTLKGCDTGYELGGGMCVEEIVEGGTCAVGIPDTNAMSYTYKNGVCTLTTCKTGFDLKDGGCTAKPVADPDIGILSQVNPTTVTIQSVYTGRMCAPTNTSIRSNVECNADEFTASGDDRFHFVFIPLGGGEFRIQGKKDGTYCREGDLTRVNCDGSAPIDGDKYRVETDGLYMRIKRVASDSRYCATFATFSGYTTEGDWIRCNRTTQWPNWAGVDINEIRFKLVRP